jgi:hypothetical protein
VEISGSSELEDEISKENENINDEIGERRWLCETSECGKCVDKIIVIIFLNVE